MAKSLGKLDYYHRASNKHNNYVQFFIFRLHKLYVQSDRSEERHSINVMTVGKNVQGKLAEERDRERMWVWVCVCVYVLKKDLKNIYCHIRIITVIQNFPNSS
jgi:hypothetical protein